VTPPPSNQLQTKVVARLADGSEASHRGKAVKRPSDGTAECLPVFEFSSSSSSRSATTRWIKALTVCDSTGRLATRRLTDLPGQCREGPGGCPITLC